MMDRARAIPLWGSCCKSTRSSLFARSNWEGFPHPGHRRSAGEGADVTAAYDRGARETLRLARLYSCSVALFKERSPACGSGQIYDGSFTKTLVDGYGAAAELLEKNGIRVLGESDLEIFLRENP